MNRNVLINPRCMSDRELEGWPWDLNLPVLATYCNTINELYHYLLYLDFSVMHSAESKSRHQLQGTGLWKWGLFLDLKNGCLGLKPTLRCFSIICPSNFFEISETVAGCVRTILKSLAQPSTVQAKRFLWAYLRPSEQTEFPFGKVYHFLHFEGCPAFYPRSTIVSSSCRTNKPIAQKHSARSFHKASALYVDKCQA